MLTHFHFLRPWWLLLLPLAVWIGHRLAAGVSGVSPWRRVCDPALLARLLVGSAGRARRWPWWLLAGATALALVALAGPVWQQMPQPLYRQQQALVLLLDLSRSMLAADSKPDRLTRAKQKLSDLLALRREGQTALVVYAGDAFVITPLTDDVRVIAQQEPVLSPGLMPVQGSRLDLALKQALKLLQNGGVAHGEVLVLTDSADHGAEEAAAELLRHGHRVSVLGFGTADGAPIPGASGFVTDSAGNIVVARTDWSALKRLATAGGGLFARATLDSGDLRRLAPILRAGHALSGSDHKRLGLGDRWREEGPWLLLALLPLAALAFRRGWLLAAVLLGVFAQPSPAAAWAFSDLWRNGDQQAKALLDEGKAKEAAGKFSDPRWKSVASYRAGEYAAAAEALAGLDDAESDYNRGNALAKAGKLKQALKAYDAALKKNPKMEDAAFNRDLVRKLLQQQKDKQTSKKKQSDAEKKARKDGQQGRGGARQNAGNKKRGGKPSGGEQSRSSQRQAGKQHAATQKKQGESSKQREQQARPSKDGARQQQQRKLGGQQQRAAKGEQRKSAAPTDPERALRQEQQQARQQWLRRIPDDPGGLLRRKFQYQYRQRGGQPQQEQGW